ncbi:MAG TPA: TIGR03943 family protein [Chthoniobacterales bacterium]|jgi:uncharacterized repeat protein (TIGR03943 family)|nr:TIGR03943 family protein [Chthoniobacterales bacterium]
MRAKVSNAINGLTLFGLGTVFIVFYATGRISQYLNPIFRPFVLIAGIGTIIAGVVYLMTTHSGQCCVDGDCVHGHVNNPRQSLAFFIVICLSVLFGAIFSKDAFDQQVVLNRGFVEDAAKLPGTRSFHRSVFGNPVSPANLGAHINEAMSGSGDLPVADDGNIALEVSDLLYAETQEPLRKRIAGKTVEVVGQFLSGSTNDEFRLVRMFMWCCAADARPIYVSVAHSSLGDVSDLEWVKVTGTAEYSTDKGQSGVLVKANSVETTDPPEEAMLY